MMDRRTFLNSSLRAAGLTFPGAGRLLAASSNVKPISGSWFEFQHHATVEGVDWNPACARFTEAQWSAKIAEMAEVGIRTLVLMDTALYYRAFYKTSIFPQWQLGCPDPIETVLSAADRHGVRFFIGNGFFGDWQDPKIVSDPLAAKRRLQAIEELATRYGHHTSFHGWYWPNEAFIDTYYADEFIRYVNTCSALARKLMPRARILIAPYGTRVARPDDKYAKQLDSMDVDIVAYQDQVGVRKSRVDETSAFYEGLQRAHDKVSRIAIWADIEIVEFEGQVYKSALVPASFQRVLRQMEAVSPWVEQILVYQYLGLMNKPGSQAFAGRPESIEVYRQYQRWRKGGGLWKRGVKSSPRV